MMLLKSKFYPLVNTSQIWFSSIFESSTFVTLPASSVNFSLKLFTRFTINDCSTIGLVDFKHFEIKVEIVSW